MTNRFEDYMLVMVIEFGLHNNIQEQLADEVLTSNDYYGILMKMREELTSLFINDELDEFEIQTALDLTQFAKKHKNEFEDEYGQGVQFLNKLENTLIQTIDFM